MIIRKDCPPKCHSSPEAPDGKLLCHGDGCDVTCAANRSIIPVRNHFSPSFVKILDRGEFGNLWEDVLWKFFKSRSSVAQHNGYAAALCPRSNATLSIHGRRHPDTRRVFTRARLVTSGSRCEKCLSLDGHPASLMYGCAVAH